MHVENPLGNCKMVATKCDCTTASMQELVASTGKVQDKMHDNLRFQSLAIFAASGRWYRWLQVVVIHGTAWEETVWVWGNY